MDPPAQPPQLPQWHTANTSIQAASSLHGVSNVLAVHGQLNPQWSAQSSQYYRPQHPISGQFSTATSQGSHQQSYAATVTPGPSFVPQHYGTAKTALSAEPWDKIVRDFLKKLGLTQALTGFEADMLILNSEWEQKQVPEALQELQLKVTTVLHHGLSTEPNTRAKTSSTLQRPQQEAPESSLDERKLEYAHFAEATKARTPSTINKDISQFLARHRARNDASNRSEFLLSLAEKKAAMMSDSSSAELMSSCARVDAKTIDREVQIKYDIAKNEEGPLRRTMAPQATSTSDAKGKGKAVEGEETISSAINIAQTSEGLVTATTHPALDERLRNVEQHFGVRYVPSPPVALMDRLKLLEEHIIRLEKDYPPWAALHFSQPNRGWPPPPRSTPIIVPSYIKRTPGASASASFSLAASSANIAAQSSEDNNILTRQGPEPSTKSKKSSLHRAVMEKLEVKQAREDLASGSSRDS